MKLKDLPNGDRIFVDANIFLSEIFEEEETVDECADFLERIKNHGVEGFTSIIVINEVFHRTAVAEAKKVFNIPLQKIATFLKKNPESFKSLKKPWEAVENINRISNLAILKVDLDSFLRGIGFSKKYGLLSNDAIHLAVMEQNGIKNLASNDSDFERIDWITLYKP
jgi:predicted nucleic acid-binding protein